MPEEEVKQHGTEKTYAGICTHYTLGSRILWNRSRYCHSGWFVYDPLATGHTGNGVPDRNGCTVVVEPVYSPQKNQATGNEDKGSASDTAELDDRR